MANKPVKFKTGYVIGNRWYMIKKIGSGTFGTVFECVDLVTKLHVAIKIEFANPYKHTLMLKHEKNILEKLQDRAHFCSFFQYGVHFQNNYPYKESFYYLAMELQGENFSKLQNGKYYYVNIKISSTMKSFLFPYFRKMIFFFQLYIFSPTKWCFLHCYNFEIGLSTFEGYRIHAFERISPSRYKTKKYCNFQTRKRHLFGRLWIIKKIYQ